MNADHADHATAKTPRRRLAIIGGGSSGLVCLKMAADFLDDWDVVCFEKSDRITGCWGNPYPGFVSTSTRYTTQFACFPICEATVGPDAGASREEFFCDGEYGEYLETFAATFELRRRITLNCRVEKLQRSESGGWNLWTNGSANHFDAVVICTGLAARPKPIRCEIPHLSVEEMSRPEGLGHITNKRIVVIGGGESAVDYANRLSNPALNNEVFLSLHSGVRVSPRYHPIRGVPSDFLRNRLMLSVHRDIRNWLGQAFVELRIKYESSFKRLFPPRKSEKKPEGHIGRKPNGGSRRNPEITSSADRSDINQVRKEWAFKLTKAAKDDLFNMFHNKSDDFLDAVGEGRIKIVGAPANEQHTHFFRFDSNKESIEAESFEFQPDLIVPAIGYQSTLGDLTQSAVQLTDFYLGCIHTEYTDLYLVGFARPIIGNIPAISEMQARYVCGLIGNVYPHPSHIKHRKNREVEIQRSRYKNLDLNSTYPVEMIPYCDRLAGLMNLGKGPRFFGSAWSWWRSKLAPASTMHYFDNDAHARRHFRSAPIYMPAALILFILLMKPVDWSYRFLRWVSGLARSF